MEQLINAAKIPYYMSDIFLTLSTIPLGILGVILFTSILEGKEDVKKKVLDQASMACRYVLHNLVFMHDEEIDWETKKSLVDSYYKSSNENNYQTRFEKLENVAYCVKGALMQGIEEKYNSAANGTLKDALDNATSEN